MSSNEVIIDRGRGPEIKGTRITVYDILDYLLAGWHHTRIAAWLRVSSGQVQAAMEYIQEHKLEVITDYRKILERCERGNPPELQARLDANHEKFLKFVHQVREAKANGATQADVTEMVKKYRQANSGDASARNHGGQ
jgi:uncharacterized protein (DUF433 family)